MERADDVAAAHARVAELEAALQQAKKGIEDHWKQYGSNSYWLSGAHAMASAALKGSRDADQG